MIKLKSLLLFIFFFLITSCDYEPILKQKNYNFSADVIETKGNSKINSIIKKNVERINGTEKKYLLYLNSSIEKKIISKDTKGDPSIIQLNILVMYEVKDKNKILISDQLKSYSNYNNISDKFELKKYEDILVENSAERLSENIITSITTIR